MNPKILVGILFLVIFSSSFLIYLFVVNVVTPHFDLSTTAKQKLEIAPELQDGSFDKNSELQKMHSLQQKAMRDLESRENDAAAAMNNDTYVPMEELTGDDDENLAGVLDTTEISNVRAPGDDRYVEPAPKQDSILPASDSSTNEDPSVASGETNTAFVPDSEVKKEDPILDEKPVTLNRVVVGSYSSIDQAKEAYDKMVDSDLEVAPIIKEVQGNYTLQVGAFTDKEKADKLVDTLKNKQYSAEVKPE